MLFFVSRARIQSDLGNTVNRIKSWRALAKARQDEILSNLEGPLFRKIKNDHSYSMAFHHCDLLLRRGQDGLFVGATDAAALRSQLTKHKGVSEIIEFENEPDCISFYGDTEHHGTQIDALEYYVDVSDVKNAVKTFRKLPKEVRGDMTPEEFERAQFLEKDLEDYLQKHLNDIEVGLKLIGRQHPTSVGPIDLYAVADNGDLVVVELKKGRASDKVFGQICRYIGCIRTEQSQQNHPVRGYIVGREVDVKLQYAAKVVPKGVIRLQTFELAGEKSAQNWIQISTT